MSNQKTMQIYGGSIGASIAVVVSWSINHSIWWAILHGALGWIYVIYKLITGEY